MLQRCIAAHCVPYEGMDLLSVTNLSFYKVCVYGNFKWQVCVSAVWGDFKRRE